VIASSSGGSRVRLGRNVIYRDVQQAVSALTSFIDDNTR
jgi:hypothetical protein